MSGHIAVRHVTRESARAALWFWPSVWAAAALVTTLLLLAVPPTWTGWHWPGGQDSAAVLLQVVASSVMAAVTVTFSLTIVALQLSSQQFSPRLLREFARDRVTQVVLAILLSTFVSAVTCVLGIGDRSLPALALALVFVLGIASAGALIAFVGHIVRSLRIDSLMRAVHVETAAMIASTYGSGRASGRERGHPEADPTVPGRAPDCDVRAAHTGFVRRVHAEELARTAQREGLVVQLRVMPGDHVTVGSPIARVWGADAPVVAPDAVQRAVEVGYERTMEQDIAYGFRQLTDIAVKAVSPAINDPVTAVHAIGYCADLLVRLERVVEGSRALGDRTEALRVVVLDRDLRYWLDLVCGPVRRYGSSEPIVLGGLLRMLRDCAAAQEHAEQGKELLRQADLVLEQASTDLATVDLDALVDLHGRVRAAAQGDLDAAYDDRAGETRSA
ncbi:DUF2254 domain-containing protein [Curtobacterium aurantiacum]|uniref:DUF2254 domain-containing protein n=1 Tax=Curtobacterium aurantiacum TaxID=3236919 RepID=UPI001BE07D2F|nr:DUF2254 domain-containing protein [Curtobacterium flaccumfaciens]MBT1676685.1 DUF2254 domain-containing protein [Curtobacterium flaccumfaciens pv. flaccumfaciens]